MKQIILEYAEYNLWANKKLGELLKKEKEELLERELKSSFKNIRLTIFHLWDAEVIWQKRIKGESLTEWPSKSIKETGMAFLDAWNNSSESLLEIVKNLSEEELSREISYKNLKGEEFKQPLYQILMHLFNHGTYHRGQLVTMLRNAGVEDGIPQTDLIAYYRVKV